MRPRIFRKRLPRLGLGSRAPLELDDGAVPHRTHGDSGRPLP